jgi:hypothetical protein
MKEELKVERRESCQRLMDINSVEKDVSYRDMVAALLAQRTDQGPSLRRPWV